MTVCQGIQIQLISSGSGHIQLPARPPPSSKGEKADQSANVYPVVGDLGKEEIASEELQRIHLHLFHCSEFAMRNLAQSACKVAPVK